MSGSLPLVLPEDDANRQLANGLLLDRFPSTWKIFAEVPSFEAHF